MTNYIPTDDEVRVVYAWDAKAKSHDHSREYEFRLWLDNVKREAYERGYEDGCNAGIDLGTIGV